MRPPPGQAFPAAASSTTTSKGHFMSTPSPIPDLVSFSLSADELQAIQDATKTLTTRFDPHLVQLVPSERHRRAKMGPRSSDFVARALSYARALPEYVPSFVSVDALQKDLDAVSTLRELQHPLKETNDGVADTILVAGSEAYAAALSIYDALKLAAKRGSPQAHAAATDLGERLGRGGTRTGARPAGNPEPGPTPAPQAPGA
jgi:hypothetical protein